MYKTYERSRFIENRFKTTLSLIDNNRLNAEQLAAYSAEIGHLSAANHATCPTQTGHLLMGEVPVQS